MTDFNISFNLTSRGVKHLLQLNPCEIHLIENGNKYIFKLKTYEHSSYAVIQHESNIVKNNTFTHPTIKVFNTIEDIVNYFIDIKKKLK